MSNRLVVAAGLAAGAVLGFIGINLVFWPESAFAQSVVGLVMLQSNTPGTKQTGHINVSGTVIGGKFQGDGSGMTALNAGNVSSGTLADARLSSNVDLLNAAQTVSGAKTFSAAPGFTASTPFTVSHTGLVSNLDADYLDGYHATAFARLGADQAFAGINTFNKAPSFTASTPFSVSSDGVVINLNADELDGYHWNAFVLNSAPYNFSGSVPGSATVNVSNSGSGGYALSAGVTGYGASLGGAVDSQGYSTSVLAQSAAGASGYATPLIARRGNGITNVYPYLAAIYGNSDYQGIAGIGTEIGVSGYADGTGGYGFGWGVAGTSMYSQGIGVLARNESLGNEAELAGPNGAVYVSTGQVYRDYVGYPNSNRVATLPIAYGVIGPDGTVLSGSGNFTCSWDSTYSRYVITIAGQSFYWLTYTATVTPQGPCMPWTDSYNGSLVVYLTTSGGGYTRTWFDFTVYAPTPGSSMKVPAHNYSSDKEWAKHNPQRAAALMAQSHPNGLPVVKIPDGGTYTLRPPAKQRLP